MARNDVISKLYKKSGTALDFNFDALTAPPLYSLFSYQDLERMYKLITSVKYASKTLYKEQEIKKIMEYYGWKRYTSGTHRVVYRHLEIPTIVAKISLNKTSLGDNIREMQNQYFLKPFVTKVFDVHPSGMIGIFERVEPFQSRDEFISVAGDIFDLINTKIIGKYVVDDIGTESYMNYGIRKAGPYSDISFGPVLLDFPEVYPLDGEKLYCNKNIGGFPCGGALDYDAGYNSIICTKCGRVYESRELMKAIESHEVIKKGRQENMKLEIMRGDTVVSTFDSSKEPTDIIRKPRRTDIKPKSQMSMISQALGRGQKTPPTHKLESEVKAKEETKVIFCGGYVNEESINKDHKSDTGHEDISEVVEGNNSTANDSESEKFCEEYNTDTGFIPKEGESMETGRDTKQRGVEDTSVQDIAEDEFDKNMNPPIEEASMEDELGEDYSDELGEVKVEESSEESEESSDEEVHAEDELGDDVNIDPSVIAQQMMSAGANPFTV